MDNERRQEPDWSTKLLSKMEEIRSECEEGHHETRNALGIIGEKLETLHVTQKANSKSISAHDRKIAVGESKDADSEKDRDKIFEMIGLDREKFRTGKAVGAVAPDSIKWIVGGVLGSLLILAIAFGAITTSDVTGVLGAGK